MACFWEAGKTACKIDKLISKARIGANTVRSFLRSLYTCIYIFVLNYVTSAIMNRTI